MSRLAETREPFLAPYWGEVTEMDELSTKTYSSLDSVRPDIKTIGRLFDSSLVAWSGLLNDENLVCDDIEAGEQFDPFDQKLSKDRFYQASGAIMLVDVERMGVGFREIPVEDRHEQQFHASSVAFFSKAQEEKFKETFRGFGSSHTLSPRADLAFSDPADKSALYERSTRLIAMLRTTSGTSVAVEPRLLVTLPGDSTDVANLSVKFKPLKETITRGLPTIRETVLERDENGEPLHVKRIRSLTVIRRGLFKPPQGNTPARKRRLSEVISDVLAPAGPRIADI